MGSIWVAKMPVLERAAKVTYVHSMLCFYFNNDRVPAAARTHV